MNPFRSLPPAARKAVYAIYGACALVVACVDVGYASANVADPTWLKITQDVLAYLAAPVGVLAVSNTPASASEVAEVVNEAARDGGPAAV
jgi:TRAP-type C4-dicarboxylate transport system permease small subunit